MNAEVILSKKRGLDQPSRAHQDDVDDIFIDVGERSLSHALLCKGSLAKLGKVHFYLLAISKTGLRSLPAETADAGPFVFVGLLAMANDLSSDVAISAAGFILAASLHVK